MFFFLELFKILEKFLQPKLKCSWSQLHFRSTSSRLHSEFYEPNALMMEEEGAVIAGLLVGLNVIDANLCMKGEDLDSQVTTPTHLTSTPFPLTVRRWRFQWPTTDSPCPL